MSAQFDNILLIVNPSSRNGASDEIERGVDRLQQAGINVIEVESQSIEKSCEAIFVYYKKVDLVVLAGGDGTISSVAKCLYETKSPFAILPLGTANDLARSLDLPASIDSAFNAILHGKLKQIDLGWVNGHYFFNVANIGLGVDITYELTPEVKKYWGVFSYLKALFSALVRAKRFRVKVKVDGKEYKLRSMHLGVGNGRYYGGGNVIDEDCLIDNGLLSIYSLKPQTVWDLLVHAPLLRYGQHKSNPRTFIRRGKRIEVLTQGSKEIHADGEFVSHTPATFKVIPKALSVVVPAQ
ncbi:MAG TPA: lipid kinase [Marinagarivorans sp.]